MKSNIAIATVVAVAAGSVGAGALDRVSDMLGSDSMKSLTLQVLDNCTALHNLGDPIGYVGPVQYWLYWPRRNFQQPRGDRGEG